MDRESLVSSITYGTYENDIEDIAHLCDAANKLSIANSGKPLCEGSFDDFVETINRMISKNQMSVGKYGLNIEKTVSIDKLTPRELYFINKVRPTDIQDAVTSE